MIQSDLKGFQWIKQKGPSGCNNYPLDKFKLLLQTTEMLNA